MQTSSYVPPFLSGYETRQTALAGSSAVPFDVFSKTQRHPRQKPKAAQSAGIRHAFLLKAPSSSLNSAGASCRSVSMTRLVWGSKVASFEPHDAEAVAFESLFLSLFKRLLRGGDGVWFTIRDDQDDLPVLAEETHLLHDPPERFRHRSHPVGDFGESGGELFTVPKDGHDRCPAFRRICAGKRRNAQIYARYALKSLSHGIAHGIRQHEPGIIHGTAAVQENVHRRIR